MIVGSCAQCLGITSESAFWTIPVHHDSWLLACDRSIRQDLGEWKPKPAAVPTEIVWGDTSSKEEGEGDNNKQINCKALACCPANSAGHFEWVVARMFNKMSNESKVLAPRYGLHAMQTRIATYCSRKRITRPMQGHALLHV